MALEHLDVTVIGAGPAGMLTFALLLECGVEHVRCFEAGSSLRHGSRATGLKPGSLEILSRLGVAEEVMARATPVRGSHTFREGVHAGFRAFTEGTERFRTNVSLDQRELEELLLAAVVKRGGDVTWNHALSRLVLDRTRDLHLATFGTPSGERTLPLGRLLAACDGSKSSTRRALGIAMPVTSDGRLSFICDVEVDGQIARDAMHQFFAGAERLVLVPLRGSNRWKASGSVVDAESVSGGCDASMVAHYIRQRTGMDGRVPATSQVSTFRLSWGLAERFGEGGVSLLGDAAHTFPPDGAFGLNTALEDGQAFVDTVLDGTGRSLLSGFWAERRSVANDALAFALDLMAARQRD